MIKFQFGERLWSQTPMAQLHAQSKLHSLAFKRKKKRVLDQAPTRSAMHWRSPNEAILQHSTHSPTSRRLSKSQCGACPLMTILRGYAIRFKVANYLRSSKFPQCCLSQILRLMLISHFSFHPILPPRPLHSSRESCAKQPSLHAWNEQEQISRKQRHWCANLKLKPRA